MGRYQKRFEFLVLILTVQFFIASWTWAADKPALVPKPQVVNWLAGAGPLGKLTVEYDSATRSARAEALFTSLTAGLPKNQIPYEGYLLQVNADGVLLLVKDKNGEIYGRQTLDQLRLPDGTYPFVTIADWPRQSWRGLHVLDSGPGTLPQIKSLMRDVLVKNRCNILVYEIDYNYAFATHPEIKADGTGAWTKEQVGELVQAGRENGIKVIPEINCLGHQSWLFPPGALLKAHPDLEEPPDNGTPQTSLASKDFYCRSWCPLNPQVNKIMFDLFGELLDAFQTNMFHVGMDEVLVIASQDCPRCKDKNPAQLYAGQVLAFHQYFAARHVTMLMWGDRLLNKQATGYSQFDSSANGTDGALPLIPKDVILCDWHYDYNPAVGFPSAGFFTGKGYRVWPTVYKDLNASKKFMETAQDLKSPLVLGTLTSVWLPAAQVFAALKPDFGSAVPDKNGDKEKAVTVVKSLRLMWNPAE
ncbi:MAG TPA: family 20 glycosylhydrolase [bacterium]|nr:family 20 glycosylhydrolase [bacterium]